MKTLYFYAKEQFFCFRAEEIDRGYSFFSISQILSSQNPELLCEHRSCYIDISCMVSYLKENDSQLYNIEQLINSLQDDNYYICDNSHEMDAKYFFRYVFDDFSNVKSSDDKSINEGATEEIDSYCVKKITDLDESELNDFFSFFNSGLYGHELFKEEFKEMVTLFRVFNKLGEHKILSLFLMGASGVGKTEVARTIHKALGGKSKLAKVNFGNYSSHDALNSLIGSPLGYIGSDGGELLKRVKESDTGLILIDEFEKADHAVYNYFLDALENGKITNSQADEYDINGYIIVFTSNMNKDEYKSRLSPELRSRFDYKGVFNLLTDKDKNKYLHFRINDICNKYKHFVSNDLPEELHDTIANKIDVSEFKNMRDLNKKIKETFVSSIKSQL